MEISVEFRDKFFIRSLKTEEASASSASMLATPLEMIYTSQSLSKIQSQISKRKSEREKYQIDVAIAWLSLLHGNVLSTFYISVPGMNFYSDGNNYFL